MPESTITLRLVAQDLASGKLSQAIGKMDQMAKRGGLLGNVMQGVGISFGMMLNPVALVTRGLATVSDVAGDAINAASDLEESTSKVGQVFTETADDIMEWAQDSAQAFGLSKQAALEASATFGNFIQAMGNTEDEAADMSTALVELAADLASFNNQDIREVLTALRSGLAGEAEPMRRLGADVTNVRVELELMEMGLEKVNGQFTQQQKVLGRYRAIMEDTTKAQGDFERTSDGLANSQRILAARMEDAMADLGQAILPVVTEFTQFTADVIPGMIDVIGGLGSAFNDLNRALNPHIAIEQDVEAAVRATAEAMGMNGDEVVALIESQREFSLASDKAAEQQRELNTALSTLAKAWGATTSEVDASTMSLDELIAAYLEHHKEAGIVIEDLERKRLVEEEAARQTRLLSTYQNQMAFSLGRIGPAAEEASAGIRSLGRGLAAPELVVSPFENFSKAFRPREMFKDLNRELKQANKDIRKFLDDPSVLEGPMAGIENKLQRLFNKLPRVIELDTAAGGMMATYIGKMAGSVVEHQDQVNAEFEAMGLESKGKFLTNAVVVDNEMRGLFPDNPKLFAMASAMGAQISGGLQTHVTSNPIVMPKPDTTAVDAEIARLKLEFALLHSGGTTRPGYPTAPRPGGWDGNPATPWPMAKGGIVTAPTLALLGEQHRPEAVIPLDRAKGFGGPNITINIGYAKDARSFVDEVGPELTRWMRRQGVA